MTAILRLNLTQPGLDATEMSARYRAALQMAELADAAGFAAVTLDEHHGATNGWLPVPLLFAGMIVARTHRLFISIQALLLPLHDPLRVAEDLIALDLVSGGRVVATVGLGYRPEEYAAHGKDWQRRRLPMEYEAHPDALGVYQLWQQRNAS